MENSISDKNSQLFAETGETKAKEFANSLQSFTDWNKYRLDLAKEITIALINTSDKNTRYGDVLALDAVKITNEIVKQLKETEI